MLACYLKMSHIRFYVKTNSLSGIISCLEPRRSEATSAISRLCFYVFLANELQSRIVKGGGERVWIHNSVDQEAVPKRTIMQFCMMCGINMMFNFCKQCFVKIHVLTKCEDFVHCCNTELK